MCVSFYEFEKRVMNLNLYVTGSATVGLEVDSTKCKPNV